MKLPAKLIALTMLLAVRGSFACNSPLVLDLNGDGVLTTSVLWEPVRFDINGDGRVDTTGWLNPYSSEGFLWMDLNHNGVVDSARELFGDAMLLPGGEPAANGFDALAVYDTSDFGGNEDGLIDVHDLIWPYLRLWIDSNFDGVCQRQEVSVLPRWKIVGISLQYSISGRFDGSSNLHQLTGQYFKRFDGRENRFEIRPMTLEDIYFSVRRP
jgi:hypothetical protein